jgi:hypothetical protein
MAILRKRRSQATLPEATSEKGVIVSRPSDKLTSTVTNRPEGRRRSVTTAVGTPAGRLTSAVKGEAVSTPKIGGGTAVTPAKTAEQKAVGSAKPALTSVVGPKSITNKVTGATRPTVSKTQGSTGNTSKLTSALTGALSGAAIGVGAKAVYDKLTGTKKIVDSSKVTGGTKGGTTGGTKGGTTGGTTGGTKGGTTGGTKGGTTGGTTGGTKGGTTGGTKGGTTGGTKGPTKPGTKGPTAPKTPTGPKTPGGTKGGTTGGTGASGFPVGVSPNARQNEDGTYTETFDDGSTITYDADGNIIGSTDAEGIETVTNEDGTTTYTYDDGSTVTVDDDGNVISSTEATDIYAEDSTDIETDEEGNTVYTYDDGSTVTIDADGNIISSTDATETEDETVAEEDVIPDEGATDEELAEAGYYEDEYGNIYDENGELIYAADDYWTDDEISEYVYTDDYGNQYDYYGNLIAEADHSDYVYTDDDGYQYDWDGNVIYDPYASIEEEEYYEEEIPEEEYAGEEEYDYEGDWWGKKGGLVALMKDGGVPHFDEGGEVEMFDDGSYIVYYDDGSYITYDDTGEIYNVTGDGSGESMAEMALDEMQMRTTTVSSEAPEEGSQESSEEAADESRYSVGNIQYFDDGSYIQTFDDGSTITVDSEGNVYAATEAPDYSVTGAGSGEGRTIYYNQGQETPAQRARRLAQEREQGEAQKGVLETIKEAIGGSGYLGAGAAGAVLGALLGNTDLFSGGSGTQNQGIDMSKVGVIPARTTEFGVGPTTYVPYEQYAARDQMPDIYGDELYRNLNAPGFNPVEEGEYGYEESSAEDENATQQSQGMADGGLAGGYYTFGKTVDPIQNLMNPRPAQQLPQAGGLPRMPIAPNPNNMNPQQTQTPPPMKSGGLPAVSNVPMAKGRLDFRQGSAVHGPGDGQSDDIPAMLADGEYVIDAETVAQIGNGSTKAGAKALDEFRQNIRKHKRSTPLDKIPPKTKALTSYLKKGN